MSSPERFEIPVPALYEAIEPRNPDYPYLIPADYATGGWLGDCLEVDEYGNPDPGFPCPKPFHAKSIGNFFCHISDTEY